MAGYKGKYIKTYLWSGAAMLLNFISMFIVAPLTTSMPEAYGVYSLCISFNIFLRYADLGFIAAGRKYAAEAFSNNNRLKEKKYVGTSIIIYGMMCTLLFLLALLGAAFPEYLIKDIEESQYYGMSHQLLLILAFTFPLSIIQKFNGLIYTVRIEEYKIQRVQIIGSAIKIASVPLYFFHNKYDIVGYYLFSEVINLLTSIFNLYSSRNIGYGFKEFFRCLKFDKQTFVSMKALAFSGFASVIGWITYYELDTVGISILLGANAVAVYAVGKQIQTLVRSFVSVIYSPYPVRINYFIGQKDIGGLRKFFYKLAVEFSVIIIPIILLVFYAKPFIFSWVGCNYEDSVLILQLLVLTFIIHHIASPGSSVIYGLNKVKDILKLAFIQPVLFWLGVFLTYSYLGVYSFAIFKLIACLITEFYTCLLVCKYLDYSKKDFYWNLFAKPLVLIGMTSMILWYFTSPMLNSVSKNSIDLLFVISVMATSGVITLITSLSINKPLREELNNMAAMLIARIKRK